MLVSEYKTFHNNIEFTKEQKKEILFVIDNMFLGYNKEDHFPTEAVNDAINNLYKFISGTLLSTDHFEDHSSLMKFNDIKYTNFIADNHTANFFIEITKPFKKILLKDFNTKQRHHLFIALESLYKLDYNQFLETIKTKKNESYFIVKWFMSYTILRHVFSEFH